MYTINTPLLLTLVVLLRDVAVLQTVCWRRGWEFRAGQRTYRWFGRRLDGRLQTAETGRCAHAIAIPGCLYEIGLVRRRGHYLPVWDDAPNGGLKEVLGPTGGVLWQGYVTETTRRAAFRRGHRFTRHTDCAGTLRLRIVAGGPVAHVRVNREGQTTLWIFDATQRSTFRYLADALGRVQSESLLDIAAQEPSLEPRTSSETIHESAAFVRPLFADGNDCPAKSAAPPAPADAGGPAGALSPV